MTVGKSVRIVDSLRLQLLAETIATKIEKRTNHKIEKILVRSLFQPLYSRLFINTPFKLKTRYTYSSEVSKDDSLKKVVEKFLLQTFTTTLNDCHKIASSKQLKIDSLIGEVRIIVQLPSKKHVKQSVPFKF
jgi:hypothetical protein